MKRMTRIMTMRIPAMTNNNIVIVVIVIIIVVIDIVIVVVIRMATIHDNAVFSNKQ